MHVICIHVPPLLTQLPRVSGTWLNSDNGFENDSLLPHDSHKIPQIPSNVTRICRAIKAESSDGIPQVVYYQAGVGTGMGLRDRFIGGTTGAGLSEHIREAYDFVANNWAPGDEIFLLGFSRGAFTARSVADLVGAVGLLTKSGMADFYAIFEDYQNSWNSDYRPAYPNVPFRQKPNARDPAYLAELVQVRSRIRSVADGRARGPIKLTLQLSDDSPHLIFRLKRLEFGTPLVRSLSYILM